MGKKKSHLHLCMFYLTLFLKIVHMLHRLDCVLCCFSVLAVYVCAVLGCKHHMTNAHWLQHSPEKCGYKYQKKKKTSINGMFLLNNKSITKKSSVETDKWNPAKNLKKGTMQTAKICIKRNSELLLSQKAMRKRMKNLYFSACTPAQALHKSSSRHSELRTKTRRQESIRAICDVTKCTMG